MRPIEPAADGNQSEYLSEPVETKRRMPWQVLGRRELSKLALAALAVCYLLLTGYWLFYFGLFKNVGGDFRAFWSAADVAQHLGYARVYDLTALAGYQRPLFDMYINHGAPLDYLTAPVTLPPLFVAIFLPLLPLGPTLGFAVWTVLNLALLAAYLVRFSFALRRATGGRLRLAAMLLAWPVYLSLSSGQIGVLLLIAVGEFTLSLFAKRPLVAGLWLGLLMIKPQLLIVVLPGLLLARQKRVLIGFLVAMVLTLAASAYLVGWEGLRELAGQVGEYLGGLSGITPEHMMNWRALAVNFGWLVPPEAAWGIVAGGTLVCSVAALWLWWRLPLQSENRLAATLLATFAATNVVAWHSHMQMAVPTIAVLAYAVARAVVPGWLAYVWMLVPAVVMMATLFMQGNPMAYSATSTFVLNLVLEAWAVVVFVRARPSTVMAPTISTLLSPAASEPPPGDEVI